MRCRKGLAQTVHRFVGRRPRSDECRHRRGCGRLRNADVLRHRGMVLPHQHVPVAVQRPDFDRAVHHALEDTPCRAEIADGAPVEPCLAVASPGKPVMAQRVEARMRVLHGPADGAAKCVGEILVGRVLAHDQVAPVERVSPGPGSGGNGRRQRHDPGNVARDRESAHLHAAEVGAAPEFLERPRRFVGHIGE